MCKIEEVKSYQIFGKLHGTREAAIDAGLTEIADTLKRNHASNPLPGLIQNADALVYLLTEYRACHPLPQAGKPAAVEGEEEPADEDDASYSGGSIHGRDRLEV